jgi:hypothetical protein
MTVGELRITDISLGLSCIWMQKAYRKDGLPWIMDMTRRVFFHIQRVCDNFKLQLQPAVSITEPRINDKRNITRLASWTMNMNRDIESTISLSLLILQCIVLTKCLDNNDGVSLYPYSPQQLIFLMDSPIYEYRSMCSSYTLQCHTRSNLWVIRWTSASNGAPPSFAECAWGQSKSNKFFFFLFFLYSMSAHASAAEFQKGKI